MNPYANCSADDLRATARAIGHPAARAHWTQVAALIGAVEDRQLWTVWMHRSLYVWAQEDLDLGVTEAREALRLWRMVQGSGIELTRWAAVSKERARLVGMALRLGGDPSTWYARALDAATVVDLRADLDRLRGRERDWIEITLRLPVSTAAQLAIAEDRALDQLAQEQGLEAIPVDAASRRAVIEDVKVRHLLVELFLRAYLGTE